MGKRILIIDDDIDAVEIHRWMLSRMGFENVETVLDSRLALKSFLRERPDVVLLDLKMPFVDGLEILEQIRKLEPDRTRLAIIVTSMDSSVEARQRALLIGANECIGTINTDAAIKVVGKYLLD